ncbi:hypothetical protein TNCV_2618831 [Trichonephila clavipes]|nr:hypothetical protein TNCV_2618831 [Trichonephila clavipes]
MFHRTVHYYSSLVARLEHSNFCKAISAIHPKTTFYSNPRGGGQNAGCAWWTALATPYVQSRNPTTSFLTATNLVYAIGAKITAAAGISLALRCVLASRV